MNLREKALSYRGQLSPMHVPEWDCQVWIRQFSVKDGLAITDANKNEDKTDFCARILIGGLCDQEGNPVFTDADVDGVKALPLALAERLALEILKANGIGTDGRDEAKKNLPIPT